MADLNQSVVDPVANSTGAGFQEAPVDDGHKVFAGNLAFATTEDELKSLFSEAGNVTNAQIITRGTRSLGYGFVSFSSEQEAQKAIQVLNKREVSGREISVESAKPQALADADKAAKSKSRKPKSRAPRRARADEGEEGGAEAVDEQEEGEKAAAGPSKSSKRRLKKKAAAAAAKEANGDEAAPNGAEAKTERAPRAKREPKGAPKGEPSKTLVYVANLAFATTDETLKAAFSEFSVKSAHVVRRRVGNRSKGFGFVDFDSQAEQQRALSAAENKEIDGRAVTLQVAVQEDKQENATAVEA